MEKTFATSTELLRAANEGLPLYQLSERVTLMEQRSGLLGLGPQTFRNLGMLDDDMTRQTRVNLLVAGYDLEE